MIQSTSGKSEFQVSLGVFAYPFIEAINSILFALIYGGFVAIFATFLAVFDVLLSRCMHGVMYKSTHDLCYVSYTTFLWLDG